MNIAELLEECGFYVNPEFKETKEMYWHDSEYVQGDSIYPFYIGRWVAKICEEQSRLKLKFYMFRNDAEHIWFCFPIHKTINKKGKWKWQDIVGTLFDRVTRKSVFSRIEQMDHKLVKLGFTRIA